MNQKAIVLRSLGVAAFFVASSCIVPGFALADDVQSVRSESVEENPDTRLGTLEEVIAELKEMVVWDDERLKAYAERIFDARKDRARNASEFEDAIARLSAEFGDDDRFKGNIPSVVLRVRGIYTTCLAVKQEMSNPHNAAILYAEAIQKATCYRAATLAVPQRPFL